MANAPLVLPSLEEIELELCRRSFVRFLRHWRFLNRETGTIGSFANLWPGQQEMAHEMNTHPWVFILKAGKLGATELECAFDAWRARFGRPNSRIHLFSMGKAEAQQLLQYVKFGLQHLPSWMRWPVGIEARQEKGKAGVDTTTSFVLANPSNPIGDRRTVVSYPVTTTVSIDQSCQHAHLDELSHIGRARELYDGVVSTVAPGGTLHIVTRGHGELAYTAELWRQAKSGVSPLHPVFVDWRGRSDRDLEWRKRQTSAMTDIALKFYAPETEQDALASPDESVYIPIEYWDACNDPALPALRPGERSPLVIALDCGTYNDSYAMAVVSRHPANKRIAALRDCQEWTPQQFGGRVDYSVPEDLVRQMCKDFNVVQICYDPFQLESLRQRVDREGWAWMDAFNQGVAREEADSLLHQLVKRGEFAHSGNEAARKGIKNARAKVSTTNADRVRIIKGASDTMKVDTAVVISMAVSRSLELNLG